LGKREEDDRESLAKYLRYSHLGVQFLLSIAVPTALGIWADRKLGTVVLFTLLGLALGFTGGIYSLYGELFGGRDRKPPGGGDPGRGDGGKG
jgi:hypothetical protein